MVAGDGDQVPHEVSSHTDDSSGREPENKEIFGVLVLMFGDEADLDDEDTD